MNTNEVANIIILGREFTVSAPRDYTSFRAWNVSGPKGALFQVIQHTDARWQRSVLRLISFPSGRDLYVKGQPALVEVQPDGSLVAVK